MESSLCGLSRFISLFSNTLYDSFMSFHGSFPFIAKECSILWMYHTFFPCTHWRTHWYLSVFRDHDFDHISALIAISMQLFLYTLSCRESALLVFRLFSEIVSLHAVIVLVCFMEEGETRISLLHSLDSTTGYYHLGNFSRFKNIHWALSSFTIFIFFVVYQRINCSVLSLAWRILRCFLALMTTISQEQMKWNPKPWYQGIVLLKFYDARSSSMQSLLLVVALWKW